MKDHEENESFLLASDLQSCADLWGGGGTLLLPGEKFPHFICKS